MSHGVRLRVSGSHGLFTRPEMKVERVSYDVMTPSAARGILEAIHWKPAIRWVIDRVHVLAPIRFQSIRRNEVGHKASFSTAKSAMRRGDVNGVALRIDEARPAARVHGARRCLLRHRRALRDDGAGGAGRQRGQASRHVHPPCHQGPGLRPAGSGYPRIRRPFRTGAGSLAAAAARRRRRASASANRATSASCCGTSTTQRPASRRCSSAPASWTASSRCHNRAHRRSSRDDPHRPRGGDAAGRPPPGYAEGRVSILVSLNPDGSVANVTDLRVRRGAEFVPRAMFIPHPVKRASGIAPNFLWDKTAYALGVTAGAGRRTADEHAAFVALHEERLAGIDDEGLQALLSFLRGWSCEQFGGSAWTDMPLDENVVFGLDTERLGNVRLHDRPAARALLSRPADSAPESGAICLVTGARAAPARLHPAIKGVWGGQTAGGSIVSFNLDAFESYGHKQGDNAPVSEAAAFAYTGALNRFLGTGSGHRVQIGDASTVFWAEADDRRRRGRPRPGLFAGDVRLNARSDTESEARRVGAVLEAHPSRQAAGRGRAGPCRGGALLRPRPRPQRGADLDPVLAGRTTSPR